MVNYPLFPPQGEDVVGFARTWWHLRQACAGNGVLVDSNDPNGMKVTRASASSVNVAAGHYANKGIWKAYAGASPAIESIPAASAGYHRYDAICVKLSDNTIVRVSGTEAVPDDVDDFLENFTPLPPDWNSTDYIELAIICVDENGIRSGDNGTYSTGGVADTRTPFVFGLDDSTLKISADGKLEVQSLYPLLSLLTTRGDMIRRSSTTWERFAAGAENTVLAMGASDPAWSTMAALLNTILTTRGDLLYRSSGDSARIAKGSQYQALMMGADDPAWSFITSTRILTIPAAAFNLDAANPPEKYLLDGTNQEIDTLGFDDTIEETAQAPAVTIPADIDSTGTVTFALTGWAKTAAASKNVQFRVKHLVLSSGAGSVDTSYSTAKDSGDLACDANQERPVIYTWTETVSNLGWSAGKRVRLAISRIAAGSDELSGDFLVESFEVRVPTKVMG